MPPRFVRQPLNRTPMRLGPEYYQSFTRAMPLSSHWRRVSCEFYECDAWLNGFVLTIDTSTELGLKQYDYVTHDKTRSYSMQRINLTEFKFIYPPGTPGFAGVDHDHFFPVGREPLWVVTGGDWRGNPRQLRRREHTRPEHWVEEFAENQIVLAEIAKRG